MEVAVEGEPGILGSFLRRVWERYVSRVVGYKCKALLFVFLEKK